MTFRITDHPIPSRPFSPSSPPDSIRFDPILSIGRNSIEKNGKNPFREDGDNPEANLIPARIERIDIGFTFAFSQCFSAVAACSAASRVCILLVLFLRRYNNDWGRAHGGRACLPTVHRSERSIDFIDNRSLDNGELHTRRFVASDIERTGRFCLPRERERGADASSKQKITSGKREDEGFMTKRRRFAADVATPFRRDRCRGICFYLIAGFDRGWAMEKERRKNETECAFAGVISTIISQTMEAHRAMGHRWPRDLGQYFLPHRSIAVVARRRCFAANR